MHSLGSLQVITQAPSSGLQPPVQAGSQVSVSAADARVFVEVGDVIEPGDGVACALRQRQPERERNARA
jgi:hypothetical protein